MVHIKKCPLGKKGKPTTEFFKDGKPQIYCYGWIDAMTDEPLKECKNCADWVNGEQCEKDFSERLKDIKKQLHCDNIDEKIKEMKAEEVRRE